MSEFHSFCLLVATPVIGDGNFERTVVLLLEHNPEGALGLVLNRPSKVPVAELLAGWDGDAGVVFVGGPVSAESVIALAREWPGASEARWRPIWGGIGSVDPTAGARELPPGEVRVFFGYAGWDGGQLEREIETGVWFVVEARPDDVFSDDPEGLWRAVLRRQPDEVSWFGNYPDVPRAN